MAPATNPNSIRIEMLRAGIAEAQRLRDKALSDNRTWLFFNRRAQEMQAELDVLETPKTAQPSLEELLTALYGSTVPLAEPTDWDATFDQLYGTASAAFDRWLDTAGDHLMELSEQLENLGEVVADKATDAAGAAQEVFGDDIDNLAKALQRLQATATSQAERALDDALERWAGIASGLAETREAYRRRRAERQAGDPTS
jgi:hypothetical protein